MVPCTLMIKILPNLEEGIKVVGFLKDNETGVVYNKTSDFESDDKFHYIMYNGDNGIILGITLSCYKSFGIPSNLVYGNNASSNEFTIDSILPDIINQNHEELKSGNGIVTTLDTSTLQQNYLVGNENGEKESNDISEDGERETRYRKTKIRARMIQDEEYQETNIRVIEFVETNENDDFSKQKMTD
jgi:hypothetical protein